MTDTKNDTWHGIADGLTLPPLAADPERAHLHSSSGGRVLRRGDEVSQSELVASSIDRFGESAFSDLSDDAQRARWGQVYLRAGSLESDRGLVAVLEAEAAAEAALAEQQAKILNARYGRRARPQEV